MRLSADRHYRLLPKLREKYQDIAATLRLEDWKIEFIKKKPFNERIEEVFKMWDENAAGLYWSDRYPHTWQGLSNIIKDSELREIRKEFFDYLNKYA